MKKEVRVLNRIIRWHPGEGVTLEADPRRAQVLVGELCQKSDKPVTTPMVRSEGEIEENEEEKQRDIRRRKAKGILDKNMKNTQGESQGEDLPPADATRYRVLVARANYLPADRP